MRTGPTHARRRFGVSVAAISSIPLLLVSCTRMLGIDGNYVLDDEIGNAGSGGGGGVLVLGNATGGVGTGGVAAGNGGIQPQPSTGGAGGTPPAESGGACSSCPPPPVCPLGNYVGKMVGQHVSSILLNFSLPVTGTVTFSLVAATGASATVTGKIEGSASLGSNSLAPFSATLSGSFDCVKNAMNGTIDGSYSLTQGAPPVTFAGTHNGSFANDAFQGTWSEHETINPSTQQYYGNGDWDAHPAGP